MHYACIIGVNHEWPEQRAELGDIGLARCLKHDCNLPKERLLEIYDQRATRSRVLYSLEELLNTRNRNATDDDVLLLYYGGHGKREEVCTFTKSTVNGKVQKEPWLRYDELIDLLETCFQGGTAMVILDCCHSGGFCEAVLERYDEHNKLHVNYGCITSVPPTDIAGMEWTITECFIRAFKGELHCSEDVSPPYCYLSTKKGKHRIKVPDEVVLVTDSEEGEPINTSSEGHPTWEQVIEFLADEMARIKGDQLTTLFYGDNMSAHLKKPCVFGDECDIHQNQVGTPNKKIPRDLSWMEPFRNFSINDEVYIKCIGSGNNGDAVNEDNNFSHLAIGWLPGRIVSIDDNNTVSVKIYNVISERSWRVDRSYDNSHTAIMSGLPFGFHNMNPQNCVAAITHFAKQLCYLDTSLHPFTPLQVLWSDRKFYRARVMSLIEVDWEHVKDHEVDGEYNVVGPYVAVQWEEEGSTSLVPLGKCIVIDLMTKRLSEKELTFAQREKAVSIEKALDSISTPMDAMLASLSCCGKQLQDVPISNGIDTGEQEGMCWEAYDAEDKDFLPVQVMNGHIAKLPLEVLAYHMLYPSTGNFSVLFWEQDSVLSLVPSNFLRLRTGNVDSCTESSSSSSSSEDDTYIEELNGMEPTSTESWQTMQLITHLCLIAVSGSVGYFVSKRSKSN